MQYDKIQGIPLLRFTSFPTNNFIHLSTITEGGVSIGNYSSFNLGLYSGDDESCVQENRKRLSSALGIEKENLITPYQTHQDKAYTIDDHFLSLSTQERLEELNGVDALITNRKGVFIGISTADCVPVLLYDPKKHVAAAIHAGWRSTVAHIVSKTIVKMHTDFGCKPKDIVAGIAPSISAEMFEVGDEVGETFKQAGFNLDKISYRNKDTGKLHIDLSLTNKLQLENAGILPENIEISGICTYSHPDKFFSARRQGIKSGRMLTGGMLL